MSQKVRRILAIVFCLGLGGYCLVRGTQAAGASDPVWSLIYLLIAGFLLLSCVGLLRPWLPRPPRLGKPR